MVSLIVRKIASIIGGFIFLYGIYIVLHGHLTPGGGFAGGVIIAGSFVLFVLAYGTDESGEKKRFFIASIFESIGALFFIGIAFFGLFLGSLFFLNFLPQGLPLKLLSAGTIPLSNIAISIKVGAGLFSIFLALAATKYFLEE
ncbi:hypothetical protein DRP53_00200 [candidate division WOR-3 bacterium]|uniref:Na+/H+ antiporter MnhB subunit-related protein domain-containing protein n=1 Tax=candidate division WOR-3 bacterium TaxID=2052148 RepID=A0A660SM17_UNCW3|nr:MAG: hypothetical protein DRP53_00200 [candidate division WOR-3 bacterium]